MTIEQHVGLEEGNRWQLVSRDIGVELFQIHQVLPQRGRHDRRCILESIANCAVKAVGWWVMTRHVEPASVIPP